MMASGVQSSAVFFRFLLAETHCSAGWVEDFCRSWDLVIGRGIAEKPSAFFCEDFKQLAENNHTRK